MLPNANAMLFPGSRVIAFDSSIYKNDVDTPLSMTMKPATVVKWYGMRYWSNISEKYVRFFNLVDVKFDDKPGITKSLFVWALNVVKEVKE